MIKWNPIHSVPCKLFFVTGDELKGNRQGCSRPCDSITYRTKGVEGGVVGLTDAVKKWVYITTKSVTHSDIWK